MRLADLVAGIVFLALNGYAVLGGADFGGGVWALLARGTRKDRQRELIADAIGPVWEANHVWLILALVLLFTCFPAAFARLGIVLHIPLSLVLIGIVLRGSAFTFWRYGGGAHGDEAQRHWGSVFAVASLITPLLLLTGATAVTALAGLWRRRYRLARVAAAAQVSLILWGWALSQYPYILPPDLTITEAAAPAVTLRLVLGALALGAVVLLPSLYYLFRVFKSRSQPSAIGRQ